MTWSVWPPMPAPPESAAVTREESEVSTLCVVFQDVTVASSLAAALSAASLVAMSLRFVWRACTADLRSASLLFAARSSEMSWSTSPDVSTPEASPESPPMDMA